MIAILIFTLLSTLNGFVTNKLDSHFEKFANSKFNKFFFNGLYTGTDGLENDFDLTRIYGTTENPGMGKENFTRESLEPSTKVYDGTSGLPADSYFPTSGGNYQNFHESSTSNSIFGDQSSELVTTEQPSNLSRSIGSSKGYLYPATYPSSTKKIFLLLGVVLFLMYMAPALASYTVPYAHPLGHPGLRSFDVYKKLEEKVSDIFSSTKVLQQ